MEKAGVLGGADGLAEARLVLVLVQRAPATPSFKRRKLSPAAGCRWAALVPGVLLLWVSFAAPC